MANDEKVDDFGCLEGMEPLAEDARVGIGEQPVPPTGAGAVSYTHLDVYKRQGVSTVGPRIGRGVTAESRMGLPGR